MSLRIAAAGPRGFGCRIDGADIAAGITDAEREAIEDALHRHQVVCVSGQPYGDESLVAFGRHFGALTVNVTKAFHSERRPEVMVLSNEVVDGKPKGASDAGQIWHTDMSYDRIAGRATILHAHKVPIAVGGTALGDTDFRDTHAVYEGLPADMKRRLDSLEAVHDVETLWNQMLARGSQRGPFTDDQRRQKPPVVHPVVLTHPWTRRKALYVARGNTSHILGMPRTESDELLAFLFDLQEKSDFVYRHKWRVGDTLMWDNCACIHLATGGYGIDQPRVMIRVQVAGDEARYRAANGGKGARMITP